MSYNTLSHSIEVALCPTTLHYLTVFRYLNTLSDSIEVALCPTIHCLRCLMSYNTLPDSIEVSHVLQYTA